MKQIFKHVAPFYYYQRNKNDGKFWRPFWKLTKVNRSMTILVNASILETNTQSQLNLTKYKTLSHISLKHRFKSRLKPIS